MRHIVKKHKLGKDKSHRESMLRSLVTQVIQYEAINTTHAKARALVQKLDHVITLGKKKNLHARRMLQNELSDELAVKKVLEVLVDRYKERSSGFAQVVKIKNRKGDNAEIVRVLLMDQPV